MKFLLRRNTINIITKTKQMKVTLNMFNRPVEVPVNRIEEFNSALGTARLGGEWFPILSDDRREKAFLVLSIGQMEQMLRAAKADAKRSTAHPGKAPKHFTRVIYMDLLGDAHSGTEGERHISNNSFMASATKVDGEFIK